MKSKSRSRTGKSRVQLLHQYYRYTGFYTFVWTSVKKALPWAALIVALLFVVDYYYGIQESITSLTNTLPIFGVLSTFFASETILGLVPPEIFIAWTTTLSNPWLYLSILGILSYLGGLTAYWMGKSFTTIPSVHQYLETKLDKQLSNSRKWGGFLIMVGALLPLPFAISCMTAGIINYSFKSVMTYGLLRLLRFAVYGIIIFNVL